MKRIGSIIFFNSFVSFYNSELAEKICLWKKFQGTQKKLMKNRIFFLNVVLHF